MCFSGKAGYRSRDPCARECTGRLHSNYEANTIFGRPSNPRILLVLNGHLAFSAGFHSWYTDANAHAGVLVFFIISGFLITTLMLSKRERTGKLDVRSFYVRRMYRVLPVAFAYLIVITLSFAISAALLRSHFPWMDTFLSWGYLASSDRRILWSGSMEYSHLRIVRRTAILRGWPLIVWFWPERSKSLAWTAVLIAPMVRYVLQHKGLEAWPFLIFGAVIDSLATGCLLALYAKRIDSKLSRWTGLTWPLALCLPALLKIGNDTHWLWPLPQLIGHSVWPLFNIFVAIGTLWAIKAKPLILNHWLPIWIWNSQLQFVSLANATYGSDLPLWPITRILISFGCAVGSYHLIEKPVLARFHSISRTPANRQFADCFECKRYVDMEIRGMRNQCLQRTCDGLRSTARK